MARAIPSLVLAGLLAAACSAVAATPAPTLAPTPAPTPAPTATLAANVSPAPTPPQITAPPATASPIPMPTTDGQGAEVVRGTEALNGNALIKQYTTTKVNGVDQLRGGVAEFTDTMNDPRVSGTVTFSFSLDLYTGAASEWGPVTIKNDTGAWAGTCTGGAWSNGEGIAWSCWLTGSGAYDGYSYYRQISKEPVPGDAPATVVGVVYPGPIPTPAP
jgi:hypothetical protein